MVVPKGDGDIRVCVDMRRANEAIIRERLPIPTVEELLNDLNGSTVFSKIDLKWGFHQILLSDDSRHISTFVTHRGLYPGVPDGAALQKTRSTGCNYAGWEMLALGHLQAGIFVHGLAC